MSVSPPPAHPRTRRFIIAVVATLFVLIVASAATGVVIALMQKPHAAAPEHSPTAAVALAKKYLNAIADGNGAEARAIDKDAYGASTSQIDNTTFTTGPALANATERIHDLTFGAGNVLQDEAWVNTSYVLAGKTYKTQLQFTWDDETKAWTLKTDIATLVNVNGYSNAVNGYPLPFTLGGVAAAKFPAGSRTPKIQHGLYFDSLVYPGVYPLVVTIDRSKLADPSTPTTTTLLVPPDPYKGGSASFKLKSTHS
jgi:hypothetical protein